MVTYLTFEVKYRVGSRDPLTRSEINSMRPMARWWQGPNGITVTAKATLKKKVQRD
jgi:hypothetical protein